MDLETASRWLFNAGIVLFALAAWRDHTRVTRPVWFDAIVVALFVGACFAYLFTAQFSNALVAICVAALLTTTIVVRVRKRRAVSPLDPAHIVDPAGPVER